MVAALTALAACGNEAAVPTRPAEPPSGLAALVDVMAQRLLIADTVAAAKWSTGGRIVDLPREHAVLAAAEAESGRRGLDPAQTTAVLQDQIEASKVVQYGPFADWTADPARAPAAASDLDRVRPELDRITTDLLDQLANTRPLRARGDCAVTLRRATNDLPATRSLDDLHRKGLVRALRSLCQ